MFRPSRLYAVVPQSQYSRHENTVYQFSLNRVKIIFSFFLAQNGRFVSETRLKQLTVL